MTELELAIEAVVDALEDEGPKPRLHRKVLRKHRKEWPALHNAIDELRKILAARSEKLTIQLAYHLWAEATSSGWDWTDSYEVQGQLRCYLCGLTSNDPFHDEEAPHQSHPYQPGVVVAVNV